VRRTTAARCRRAIGSRTGSGDTERRAPVEGVPLASGQTGDSQLRTRDCKTALLPFPLPGEDGPSKTALDSNIGIRTRVR